MNKTGLAVFATSILAAVMSVAGAAEITINDLTGNNAPAGAIWLDTLDLKPLRGAAVAGKAVGGKDPICLDKQSFVHGIGTRAVSTAGVELKKTATRFVSVVGVDDTVGKNGSGAILFG